MNSDERSHSNNNTENKVIAFGDLRQADSISVQTERSNYQFSILDPINRMGMLTGGILGVQVREAILIGAISEDDALYDRAELKTGCRVSFLVGANNCAIRIVTSVATEIAYIKGTTDGKRAA